MVINCRQGITGYLRCLCSYMFANCINLQDISGIKSFNTMHVYFSEATSMFINCSKLISIPSVLTNIINGQNMFNNCISLSTINSNIFEYFTSEPSNRIFDYAFANCSSLLYCSAKLTVGLKSINNLFKNCTNLSGFDSNNFFPLYNGGTVKLQSIFENCSLSGLKKEDVDNLSIKLWNNTKTNFVSLAAFRNTAISSFIEDSAGPTWI